MSTTTDSSMMMMTNATLSPIEAPGAVEEAWHAAQYNMVSSAAFVVAPLIAYLFLCCRYRNVLVFCVVLFGFVGWLFFSFSFNEILATASLASSSHAQKFVLLHSFCNALTSHSHSHSLCIAAQMEVDRLVLLASSWLRWSWLTRFLKRPSLPMRRSPAR